MEVKSMRLHVNTPLKVESFLYVIKILIGQTFKRRETLLMWDIAHPSSLHCSGGASHKKH